MTQKEAKVLPENWTNQLKEEIQAFHIRTGMELSVIGRRAIDNSLMWKRLASGGTITLEKADKLRAWMAAQ